MPEPPLIAELDDEVRMRAALSGLLRTRGFDVLPSEDTAVLPDAVGHPISLEPFSAA